MGIRTEEPPFSNTTSTPLERDLALVAGTFLRGQTWVVLEALVILGVVVVVVIVFFVVVTLARFTGVCVFGCLLVFDFAIVWFGCLCRCGDERWAFGLQLPFRSIKF